MNGYWEHSFGNVAHLPKKLSRPLCAFRNFISRTIYFNGCAVHLCERFKMRRGLRYDLLFIAPIIVQSQN